MRKMNNLCMFNLCLMIFCAQICLRTKFNQGTVTGDIHGHPQSMSSFSKVTKAEITMLKELRMQSNERKQELTSERSAWSQNVVSGYICRC